MNDCVSEWVCELVSEWVSELYILSTKNIILEDNFSLYKKQFGAPTKISWQAKRYFQNYLQYDWQGVKTKVFIEVEGNNILNSK